MNASRPHVPRLIPVFLHCIEIFVAIWIDIPPSQVFKEKKNNIYISAILQTRNMIIKHLSQSNMAV